MCFLNFLKSAKQKIKLIVEALLIDSPFSLILFLGITYAFKIIFEPYSEEQYKILFGAIGLTATLSGLSFRACSATQDNDKKSIFYFAGERFFHATILFLVAILMKYYLLQLKIDEKSNIFSKVMFYALICSTILFFNYGVMYFARSLKILHTVLFKGNEKPLD